MVQSIFFKSKKVGVEGGVKNHAHKGKESAIKDIRNLAVKNDSFGDIEHGSLVKEMKDKAIPLLMLTVMKNNCDINQEVL